MLNLESCPSCGSRNIEKVRRTWRGEFEGQCYAVPDLEFYECPDCGERVYDREAMRKIEAHSPAFQKARAAR
jgi:YgiT-type zinc finger domain-containing protein